MSHIDWSTLYFQDNLEEFESMFAIYLPSSPSIAPETEDVPHTDHGTEIDKRTVRSMAVQMIQF
jgi:hypothetical protein